MVHSNEAYEEDYSELNRFQMTKKGSKVALIGVGNFYQKAQAVAALLAAHGIDATVINPRYLTGVDETMLNKLREDHEIVATLEDGSLDGGFGERIARFYGATSMRVLNFGVKKALYDRYDVQELMRANHLLDEQIAEDILQTLQH